jgi:hypothetical protein
MHGRKDKSLILIGRHEQMRLLDVDWKIISKGSYKE